MVEVALIAITCFLGMMGIERLMRVYFEKRKSSFLVMALSYLFYWVFMVILGLLHNTYEATLALLLIALVIISLNYEALMIRRLAVVVSVFALLFTLGFTVFVLLYHYSFANISRYDVSIVWMKTNSVAVVLLAFLLQGYKNLKKDKIVHLIPPRFYILSMTVPVLSIAILFIFALYSGIPALIETLIILFIFVVNVLDIHFHDVVSAKYDGKLRLILHKQEKESYLTQNQLMQESVSQIKSIRHDIKIHLATIKGYATKISADEITDYINNLLDEIDEVEIYSNTGNIAVDSIINYKLKNAKQENIHPDICLQIPPVLNVEGYDIATILGNLLDNSLDAVANAEEKMINLKIKFNKGILFIQLDNTFDGVIKYIKGAEENHITTRKKGQEHGYGLKNIKRSIEKYNGHMDITQENTIFSVSIILYVDS